MKNYFFMFYVTRRPLGDPHTLDNDVAFTFMLTLCFVCINVRIDVWEITKGTCMEILIIVGHFETISIKSKVSSDP